GTVKIVLKLLDGGGRLRPSNASIVLNFVRHSVTMRFLTYRRLPLFTIFNLHCSLLHILHHGHHRSPLDCLHTLPVRVAVYSEGCLQSSVARIHLFAYTALFLMRCS